MAEELAYLLSAHALLGKRDVLSSHEAPPSSFIDIPGHVCSSEHKNTTCVSDLLICFPLFASCSSAL